MALVTCQKSVKTQLFMLYFVWIRLIMLFNDTELLCKDCNIKIVIILYGIGISRAYNMSVMFQSTHLFILALACRNRKKMLINLDVHALSLFFF